MELDSQRGAIALALGYLFVLSALFNNPTSGVTTATASVQGLLFFVAFPILGLLSAIYVYLTGPLHTVVGFIFGSYLAVVGFALLSLALVNAVFPAVLGFVVSTLGIFTLVSVLYASISQLVPDL